MKKNQELQEELKKYQTKASVKNKEKISLRDIELDEDKLGHILQLKNEDKKEKEAIL